MVATLIENLVRIYSNTRYVHRCPPTVLNFHWKHFKEAEQILINQFHIPKIYAADLLPRLDPKFMGEPVRRNIRRNPGRVQIGVCESHRQTNYQQYQKLRWVPPSPPDHDQDEAHQRGLRSYRCNKCLPQPSVHLISHLPEDEDNHEHDNDDDIIDWID